MDTTSIGQGHRGRAPPARELTATSSASRLPVALARRIDRLARRAHRFHRFAHHPLCAAYDGETLHVGRRGRVCRGCAAAAMGGALGVALGVALPVPPAAVLATGLLVLAAVAFALVRVATSTSTSTHDRDPLHCRRRASKLVTRSLPTASAACLAVLGARAASGLGLAVAAGAIALVAGGALAYRRRGPDRSPCVACAERGRPQACSGFASMARREKAFSRVAARLLRRVPPTPAAR